MPSEYKSQIWGKGNNIPDWYLAKFTTGGTKKDADGKPDALVRFLEGL